jgi:AbiU2
MDIDERIAIASGKVEKIIGLLRTLIQVRANNEFLLYSSSFSNQVGQSYAANAFNILTTCLYETEITRLCAIWDAARDEQQARDRNSLPAISWLIGPNEVVEALGARAKESRLKMEIRDLGPQRNELSRDFLVRLQARQAEREAEKVTEHAKRAKEKIAEILASDLHIGLKNFRDKNIAHSLVETALDKKGKVSIPKYGHEKELLDKTIDATSDLYYVLSDASFSWDTAWANSRLCAEALLSKTQLNVVS